MSHSLLHLLPTWALRVTLQPLSTLNTSLIYLRFYFPPETCHLPSIPSQSSLVLHVITFSYPLCHPDAQASPHTMVRHTSQHTALAMSFSSLKISGMSLHHHTFAAHSGISGVPYDPSNTLSTYFSQIHLFVIIFIFLLTTFSKKWW